jgi:drug/metabolite transporter (DMT)-like permease
MDYVSETIIGVILAIIGAFINNFGVVLQKRQVNLKTPPEMKEKTMMDIGKFLKDPLWDLGILMQTILYLPFLLFSYDFIGITLVQPISACGLIFLILGLFLMVNERFKYKSEYIGMGILIFGIIIIALGGVIGTITIDIFIANLSNFWILFLIMLALSCLSVIMIIKNKARFPFFGILLGNIYSMVSISMQWFQLGVAEFSHALGLLILILGIGGAIAGTILGIITAQEAYKRGQAIWTIPFMQIIINILPVLAGIFVFAQTITNLVFFWIGIGCIIVGGSMLARFEV